MANSISKKVKRYLTKHPEASNQDLYKKFPRIRRNTLRHYKSRFADELIGLHNSSSPLEKKRQMAAKETLKNRVFKFLDQHPQALKQELYEAFKDESKKSLSALNTSYNRSHGKTNSVAEPSVILPDNLPQRLQELEKRLSFLEQKFHYVLNEQTPHAGEEKNFIINGIRELEEHLTNLIKERQQSGQQNSSTLEELQQLVSRKISTFIASLKHKKK